ncbi:hypothetical protein GGR50DRAFT_696631 [Xylaria sp. CBS 124048]|nr:hypothetical protein GGR50DRAFT_696631 [Xylaria sp. CBS 124048]
MATTTTTTTAAMNGYAPDPSTFGRRLFPHVVDDYARREPERECFSVPRSPHGKDGWRKVTFREYANAINHMAHVIRDGCGIPAPGTRPTIAYIGGNDARYVIFVLAALKAGYKALYISPRNSLDGQLSLFEASDCRIIAFPANFTKIVEPWLQVREMRTFEVGSVDDWFPKGEVEDIPFTQTFEEAEMEPLCVLHTSGSTGIPTPIVTRHGMLANGDRYQGKVDSKGRKNWLHSLSDGVTRNLIPMPLFHAAGLYAFLTITLYYATPVALGLPDRPLTPDTVIESVQNVDVTAVFLPPAILEEMSRNDSHVKELAKLKVFFAGGTLSTEAGNSLVARGVHLGSIISSTECFPFAFHAQTDPKLWQYFLIDSEDFGVDWRKVDENVYRLVCIRREKSQGMQGFFYTFPDRQEFDTKDLYKPHPTLPDHWIYVGRFDNIIVFSSGEKLNPVTIEDTVTHHPEINGVLVAGSGRFQPCLILEPVTQPANEEEANALIERVWPLVATANEQTVAHGQIGREYVMLTTAEKPFPRAGKGTIQRASAIKMYAEEINKLYAAAEAASNLEAPELNLSSEEGLARSIRSLFGSRIGFKGELDSETDFFSSGVDSIQVISLSRLLRTGLEAAGYFIDSAVLTPAIYSHPTSQRLAEYILSRISGNGTAGDDEEALEIQRMEALWKKYTSDLPKAIQGRPAPLDKGQTAVITGTTGTLGSYMLDQMVRNPGVKRVICLNRGEDGGKKRQLQLMKDRNLVTDYESKCTFLRADMSRADFGLSQEAYNDLLENADRFIHNAWPVNFNLSVESFEPHIRSVRNIADLAAQSKKRIAVVFISSIATGESWAERAPLLPEERLTDLSIAAGGYGRSKAVGSLILDDVARAAGFPSANIRVGQIAGPEAEAGFWNKQEWLPSIIASSLYLGALPKDLAAMDRVDWIPVERIAGLVLDVGGVSQTVAADDISGYYHGVNPHTTTWAELAPAVQSFYGKERVPELIDFREWVRRLEISSQDTDVKALEKNPGVKLLDTYRAMALAGPESQTLFDMARTQACSPSVRSATAVTPELMVHWCKQWRF